MFGKIFAILEEFLVKIILEISKICSVLPFSKILVVTPSFWQIILYYVVISFVVLYFYKNKIKFLKFILETKYKKIIKDNYKKIVPFCLIIIACINVFKIFPQNLKIYFVDVGQGDCSVIKSPYGKNIIIDGGNNQDYDYGENVVVPYLLDRKIKKIDFLLVSHFDSDHCGGLFAVLNNIKVENVIIGKQAEAYENCTKFLNLAREKNVNVISVRDGDSVKIDKNTYFQILWPDTENMVNDNGINNNSMLAKLVYGKFSMLFTGDIEEKAEQKIIEKYKNSDILNCNILKVAHHGSKSSSIQEILDEIKPQIAVIGVGSNNTYGHPNKDVISRIEAMRR